MKKNSLSTSHLEHSNFLAEYTIISPLGRGAGSFVYRVQSRKSLKNYALKVIDKNQANFESIKIKIFNEIEIHKQLKHENIVQFITSFQDEDNQYILLEFCEGGELYNFLKKTSIMNHEIIKGFAYEIAQALKYLHDRNIIHRDLKLGNILLTKEQKIKICDFGLAVRLSEPYYERNTLCGTPNYISPEILNNEPYGEKIDCWSFGCVLFFLFFGHAPFEGDSLQETLNRIKQNDLKYPKEVDPILKDLFSNILTLNSKERFDITQILNHDFFQKNKKITKNNDKTFELKNLLNKPNTTRNQNNNSFLQMFNLSQMSCRGNKENSPINSNFFEKIKGKPKPQSSYFGTIKGTITNERIKQKASLYVEKILIEDKENNFKGSFKERRRNNTVHISSNISNNPQNSGYEMTLGKKDLQLNDENIDTKRTRNFSNHAQQLVPLKSKDLEPCAFNLKRCRFEILDDFSVKLEIFNKDINFKISPNGENIEIQNHGTNKTYKLYNLPEKYHKFYLYGNKICEMVRSKTPKIIINNEDGQFYLMKNDPNPNFEAVLKNGDVIFLKAFSNEFKLVRKNGEIINLENYANAVKKHQDVKDSLKKAYLYLKTCLKRV